MQKLLVVVDHGFSTFTVKYPWVIKQSTRTPSKLTLN